MDAVEEVGGALATTAEEATKKTTQVDVQVDINIKAKASTAVHDLVGRVGEGCARQPGEHKHVRTHFACGENEGFERTPSIDSYCYLCVRLRSECLSQKKGSKGILSRKKERTKADDCKQPKVV